MSTQALTSYDIETDNVSSYASFVYTPNWIEDFIGARYRYETLVVLDPDAYWTDVTYSNAWSTANSVPATAGRCYSTLLSVQQFDADDGSREGTYNDESPEVCAPQRCLVVIQEFWSDGSMHLIDAGWYRVGASYAYTAYDYPDMLFLYWDGDVHSSNRTISGVLSSTSFYAAAIRSSSTSAAAITG